MSIYKQQGIYKIVNHKNNKIYIGYASISLGDRRDSHFACLRNGYHFNKDLQDDFNKYGEENFSFEVVEVIDSDDIEVFKEKEKYYIKQYNTIKDGYNMSAGGDSSARPTLQKIKDMAKLNRKLNIGKTASEDARKNMRAARARNSSRLKGENNSCILTKEIVFEIKNRLMQGDGVNDIAREYDVSPACISQINVGKNWKSVFVPGWNEYLKSRGL